MRFKKDISDAEIRGMQVMRKRGKSYRDIGFEFGCSDKLVASILQERGEKKLKRSDALRPEQIRAIEQGFIEYKTHKQISEETGISTSRIANYLATNKISLTGKKKERTDTYKIYKDYAITVPCPIADCAVRKSCKDIDDPRQCKVWQLVYVKSKKNENFTISEH